MTTTPVSLIDELIAGDQRALALAISAIEDRKPGYRELVGRLHHETTDAHIIGVTGSPGSGKSTLVNRLAEFYRSRDETVGIIAIDPSSPFTGGAVLGDRIRMSAAVGDDGIFVRSMSARGSLGGLSTATADAVKAMDAAGKDRIIIETVGAGQNEIDVVKTADSVLVLVPPQSGDAVQMLKAGILEIADIFVVNKADLDGADRTVKELLDLIEHDPIDQEANGWSTSIVETVATDGTGVDDLGSTIDTHSAYLETSNQGIERDRKRYAEEVNTIVREELAILLEREIDRQGGIDELAEAIRIRETDPYTVAESLVDPLRVSLRDDVD